MRLIRAVDSDHGLQQFIGKAACIPDIEFQVAAATTAGDRLDEPAKHLVCVLQEFQTVALQCGFPAKALLFIRAHMNTTE